MFIVSHKNLLINLEGGRTYSIRKEYIGDIPDEIASHPFVQKAIESGDIVTPAGHADKAIYQADAEAESLKVDIRPDAQPKAKGKAKRTLK